MEHRLSDVARNAAVAAVGALLNGGTIEIRVGAKAAGGVGAADSSSILAILTFGSPAFGTPGTGTIAANAITADNDADAGGSAGHFLSKDSLGVVVADGLCSGVGGGGDMIFTNPIIVQHGVVAISSYTMTQPTT